MLEVGSPIDRYTVERHLGSGAAADVYLVRHQSLDSLHALKLTHFSSRIALARTLQEGRFQASLRHPNIVPVHDVITFEGRCALLLEFIAGPPLDRLLRAHRPTLDQVDALARGILAGVAAAHQRGLVHRDLKPANVLLECVDGEVRPRISDFGIARSLEAEGDTHTRTGVAMGTPDYMPPEQIRSASRADARSDVYALGAMLYELLAGSPPISADNLIARYQKQLSRDWRPLQERAPAAPARMIQAVERALDPEPDARPADARELLALWVEHTPAPRDPWPPAVLAQLQALTGLTPLEPTLDLAEAAPPTPLSNPTTQEEPDLRPAIVRLAPRALVLGARALGLLLAAALGLLLVLLVAHEALGPRVELEGRPPPVAGSAVEEVPAAPAAPPEAAPTTPPAAAPKRPPEPPAAATPKGSPPEPAVRAQPAPEPPQPTAPARSEARPSAPAPRGTSWALRGVERGHLVAADGTQHAPGPVPPGSYTLRVFFPGDAHATSVRKVTVEPGAQVTWQCEPTMRSCR